MADLKNANSIRLQFTKISSCWRLASVSEFILWCHVCQLFPYAFSLFSYNWGSTGSVRVDQVRIF